MTICTFDQFWAGSAQGCGATLALWLRDRGSLTRRIQQRAQHFAVRPLRSGLARIAYDESSLLNLASYQFAYSREVFLYADDQPVVFAHSTCAQQHLRGAWSSVAGLGSQPLGALLFSHPLIERKSLHYKKLRARHPLYQRATQLLDNTPAQLWARRSLFYLHGAPLLVTEVFLPEILKLNDKQLFL